MKGRGPTARLADGQAAGIARLSLSQVCFELAASRIQSCLVLPQFRSVFANLFEIIADLLTVFTDFFFASSVANVPSQLRAIFSQLLVIPTQLLATFFDFVSCIANIFEILSNLRLIMMATIVMTNVTPIIFVMSLVVTVPLAVMIVFPEMIMVLLSLRRLSQMFREESEPPQPSRSK